MEENKIEFTNLETIDRIISNAEQRIDRSQEAYLNVDDKLLNNDTMVEKFINSEFKKINEFYPKRPSKSFSDFNKDSEYIDKFYEGSINRLDSKKNDVAEKKSNSKNSNGDENRLKKFQAGYEVFKSGLHATKENIRNARLKITEEANELYRNLYRTYKLSYNFLQNLKKEFETKKNEHKEVSILLEEKNKQLEKVNSEINDLEQKIKSETDKNKIAAYENQIKNLNITKNDLDSKVKELSEKLGNFKISEFEERITKLEEKNSKMKELLVSYAERFKKEKIKVTQISIIEKAEKINSIDVEEKDIEEKEKTEEPKDKDNNQKEKAEGQKDKTEKTKEKVENTNKGNNVQPNAQTGNNGPATNNAQAPNNAPVGNNGTVGNNAPAANNAQAQNPEVKEEKALSIFDGDRTGIILGYISINDPFERREAIKENYPAFLEALSSSEIKLTSSQKNVLKRIVNEDCIDSASSINFSDNSTKKKISNLFEKYGNGALTDKDYNNVFGKGLPNIVSNTKKIKDSNIENLNELANNFYSQVNSGRINDEKEIADFQKYIESLLRQGEISTSVNELTSNVIRKAFNKAKANSKSSHMRNNLRSTIKNGEISRNKSSNMQDELSEMTNKDVENISINLNKEIDKVLKPIDKEK